MNKYDKVVELLNETYRTDAAHALAPLDPIPKIIDKIADSKIAKKISNSKAYKKVHKIANTDVGKLASKAGSKFKSVAKKLFGKK